VWDPLTGDIAQLLPIVRAGCALGMPEYLDYEPDRLQPVLPAGVNREGRLCVQIGVLGTPREPFTSFQMIGLASILGWLDSWRIPRRWPAGQPAPYRQLARPRSRAMWARGGHFGASQVPECDNIGPGGIDIDHLTRLDADIARPLPDPAGLPTPTGPPSGWVRAASTGSARRSFRPSGSTRPTRALSRHLCRLGWRIVVARAGATVRSVKKGFLPATYGSRGSNL
jgi:hypothetical protein